ncbi:hypothetical protein [Azospirillum rugosum]|uniref:Uncharacterized protein n=1 Tax=Azospirillum rugosum TaxID=416170 RepID=A0ABS4SSJ7_9PROT|nr:hypothetical protein [Azospirillum rugosum]MBP2295541.1 hypothetical protein [Azospirillum rugosum]MDQ0528420.1 hypothetical protein [Azospirillum rugosum]
MKAFGIAVIFAVVLAVGASFVLQGGFSRMAENAFATPSVRLSKENTVEYRDFMGPPETERLAEKNKKG